MLTFLVALTPLAAAKDYRVPADGSFPEVVAAASANSGKDAIEVEGSYDGSTLETVDLLGQDVEIEANGATLPAMISDGGSVSLRDATVTGMATVGYDGSEELRYCVLCFAHGKLALSSVRVVPDGAGGGVLGVDEELDAEGLDVAATWSDTANPGVGVGLLLLALDEAPATRIADSDFVSSSDGAFVFYTDRSDWSVEATDVRITGASGNTGGAMLLGGVSLSMSGTIRDDGASTSSISGSGSAGGPLATLFLVNASLELTDVDLTDNGGTEAGLVGGLGSVVSVTGGTIRGNASSSGVEIAADSVSLTGVSWWAQGAVEGAVATSVKASTIRLEDAVDGQFTTLVHGTGGSVVVDDNTVCGQGLSGRGFASLILAESAALDFRGNVVTGVAPATGSIFAFNAANAAIVDNTFVQDDPGADGAFVAGSLFRFTYVNNLVSEGGVAVRLDAEPTDGTINYNLHDRTTGAWTVPAGSDRDSRLSGTPADFVADFDPAVCGSVPALQGTSWAVDHGDPGVNDAYGTRSDIGAVDFGAAPPEDTGGDTAEDTGGDTAADSGGPAGDTAALDADGDGFAADDCDDGDPAIHPGADDVPDDGVDQDCDGSAAVTTWAGGCGCAAAGGRSSAALACLMGAALTRRRRR